MCEQCIIVYSPGHVTLYGPARLCLAMMTCGAMTDRRTHGGQQSKMPICIAIYHKQLASKALRYGTC